MSRNFSLVQGVCDYEHISQAKASIHLASFLPRKERSSTPARQDPWVQINTRLGDRSTSTLGHSLAGGSSPINNNFYCMTAQSFKVVSCCLLHVQIYIWNSTCKIQTLGKKKRYCCLSFWKIGLCCSKYPMFCSSYCIQICKDWIPPLPLPT